MNTEELKKIRKIQNKTLAKATSPRGATAKKFGLFAVWFTSDDPNKATPEQMCVDLHITSRTAEKWVKQIESGQTAIGRNEVQMYTAFLKNLVYEGKAVAADRELYAKIIGAIPETKAKIELSGLISHDIIAGIILKADRDSNIRASALPERPALLRSELCLPSGQGEKADSQI